MTITRTSEHIRVEGHRGTWYVIGEARLELTSEVSGKPVTIPVRGFLLEHENYGDVAPSLIVDENGTILLEDVYNGFEDLEDAGWTWLDKEDGE